MLTLNFQPQEFFHITGKGSPHCYVQISVTWGWMQVLTEMLGNNNCVYTYIHTHTHTYAHTHIYIYIIKIHKYI